MKEVKIVWHRFYGQNEFRTHSILFEIKNKQYLLSSISDDDYKAFKRMYNSENATGFAGYNFLKKRYEEKKPESQDLKDYMTPEDYEEYCRNPKKFHS